jgi:hypothetical protein
MKKILFLVILTIGILSAQDIEVFNNKTLINSQSDTSAVIIDVPTFKQISGFFSSNDSTNGILYTDYRLKDGQKFAVATAETITVASSTGAGYGTAIRSHWNDKVPGSHQLRFRFVTLSSGNNTQATIKRYNFNLSIEK